MPSLSDHTKLINLLIALGHRTPDLPHSLEDIGYVLDFIGLRATLPTGIICPDVTFKSHRGNNLLMIEVKSGGVDNEQAERYSKITSTDLSKQGVTSLPAPNLKFELAYAGTEKNKKKILDNERQYRWGFPILLLEDHTLKREPNHGKFKERKLEKLFARGVKIEREPSCQFFPFSESDSHSWIAFCLLSKMAQFAAIKRMSFSEKELLEESHPLIEYFWRDEKEAIYRVMRATLTKLNELRSTKVLIKKHPNNVWEIVNFDFKKTSAKFLMDLAESIEDHEDLEQILKDAAKSETS